LIAHLLKWQSQVDELSGCWRESEGKGWRDHNRVTRTNCRASREPTKPQARIADGMERASPKERALELKRTGGSDISIPSQWTYTPRFVLDEGFYPGTT
jgi:hypothetical protein